MATIQDVLNDSAVSSAFQNWVITYDLLLYGKINSIYQNVALNGSSSTQFTNGVGVSSGADINALKETSNVIVSANFGAGNDFLMAIASGVSVSSLNSFNMGAGSDFIFVAGNFNDLDGAAGNNMLVSLGNSNNIHANGGANDIFSWGNSNTISVVGGAVQDVVSTGNNNTITTGNGNDVISSAGNGNTISAGAGNNSINSNGNGNTITTGGGGDTVISVGNTNVIKTTGGNDTVTSINSSLDSTLANKIFDSDGNDKYNLLGDKTAIMDFGVIPQLAQTGLVFTYAGNQVYNVQHARQSDATIFDTDRFNATGLNLVKTTLGTAQMSTLLDKNYAPEFLSNLAPMVIDERVANSTSQNMTVFDANRDTVSATAFLYDNPSNSKFSILDLQGNIINHDPLANQAMANSLTTAWTGQFTGVLTSDYKISLMVSTNWNQLDAGFKAVDNMVLQLSDGNLTTETSISFTIIGVNTAAQILGPSDLGLARFLGGAISGDIDIIDPNIYPVRQDRFGSIEIHNILTQLDSTTRSFNLDNGILAMNEDGQWSYIAKPEVNAGLYVDSFKLISYDGTASKDFSITNENRADTFIIAPDGHTLAEDPNSLVLQSNAVAFTIGDTAIDNAAGLKGIIFNGQQLNINDATSLDGAAVSFLNPYGDLIHAHLKLTQILQLPLINEKDFNLSLSIDNNNEFSVQELKATDVIHNQIQVVALDGTLSPTMVTTMTGKSDVPHLVDEATTFSFSQPIHLTINDADHGESFFAANAFANSTIVTTNGIIQLTEAANHSSVDILFVPSVPAFNGIGDAENTTLTLTTVDGTVFSFSVTDDPANHTVNLVGGISIDADSVMDADMAFGVSSSTGTILLNTIGSNMAPFPTQILHGNFGDLLLVQNGNELDWVYVETNPASHTSGDMDSISFLVNADNGFATQATVNINIGAEDTMLTGKPFDYSYSLNADSTLVQIVDNVGSDGSRYVTRDALVLFHDAGPALELVSAASPGDSTVVATNTHDHLLLGFAGDDILRGNTGNDYLDGGAGYNTADYGYFVKAMYIDLENNQIHQLLDPTKDVDKLINIQEVIGTILGDVFTSNDNCYLLGKEGDDTFNLNVRDSNVKLNGGNGDDHFILTANAGDGIMHVIFEDYTYEIGERDLVTIQRGFLPLFRTFYGFEEILDVDSATGNLVVHVNERYDDRFGIAILTDPVADLVFNNYQYDANKTSVLDYGIHIQIIS